MRAIHVVDPMAFQQPGTIFQMTVFEKDSEAKLGVTRMLERVVMMENFQCGS